jgi:hypothetical protein
MNAEVQTLDRNRLAADCCGRRVEEGRMSSRGLICPACELKMEMEAKTMAKKMTDSKALKTRVAEADGKKYLAREYKGKEYKVTVHNAEDKKGFTFDGKLYRSLTDVARTITGQKIINGPKFFGLRGLR